MSNDDVWKRIEHAQFLIDIKRPQQAIEQLVTIPQGDLEVAARVNCTLAQAHLLSSRRMKRTRVPGAPLKPPPMTCCRCTGCPPSSRILFAHSNTQRASWR